MKNIKTLKVEHWNTGEFITKGDDWCEGFPTNGAEYMVIKEEDFNKLAESIKIIFTDESGDLEFVKHQINKLLKNE